MSSPPGIQSVVNQARSAGAAGRVGRALRVGSVPTVLCPRCKALAVCTPSPVGTQLDWYRCQRSQCRYAFAADMIRTAGARHR